MKISIFCTSLKAAKELYNTLVNCTDNKRYSITMEIVNDFHAVTVITNP